MGDVVTIKELLAGELTRRGVALPREGLDLQGDDAKLNSVWRAFADFASAPIGDIYPGLYVPGPGFPDMDRVSLEVRPTPEGFAAAFERQIYLVDEDDEWQRSDSAGLRIKVSGAEHPPLHIGGGAGPTPTGGSAGLEWVRQVEASSHWVGLRKALALGRLLWD